MIKFTKRAIGAALCLATIAGTALAAPAHKAGVTPPRAAAAAKPAAPAAAMSAPMVRIDNFTFNAATITVKVGTTVTWTNGDDIPHTVVAKDKSFKSKVLDTGDTFTFTFTKAGEYDYFCSLHPHMTGRVIVKA
jgi:plastocyanin